MTRARPHTILVVEDEPAVADLLVTLLRDEGYTVDLARDGAAAMHLLGTLGSTARRYDLILLDMMLPGVNGPDVLRHWSAVGCPAPVIALSADPAVLRQAATLGAAATLGKPFDVADLLTVVERHIAPNT